MKVFIVCALIAISQATVLQGTGASQQFRSQDNAGNYAFGYDEGHATGGTFRRESGSHGIVTGSYGLTAADGRQRVVNYVADAAGFRADVQTNEPGVEPKDPAATTINKAAVVLAAAPAVHHGVVLNHAVAPAVHYGAAINHVAPAIHYGAAVNHAVPAIHYGAAINHAAPVVHYGGVLNHGGYNLGHYGLGYSSLVNHHY